MRCKNCDHWSVLLYDWGRCDVLNTPRAEALIDVLNIGPVTTQQNFFCSLFESGEPKLVAVPEAEEMLVAA